MISKTFIWTATLAFFLGIGSATGQIIFVDTSDDVVDFGGAQQIANLPGPDGKISLAEAGLASDNTPGVQTIGFHIPQNEWLYQAFFPGRAVLKPFGGFRVFDTVILDATTQTAFTGDTYPGGGEVVIWEETYLLDNVGGAMFGFDHSSINVSGGSGNVIQSNTDTGVVLYDSTFNLIGGANPGQGNTGGIIQIDRASNNIVVGNTAPRIRVLGGGPFEPPTLDNRIGGPTPGERNFIIGFGTLNNQGIPSGYALQLFNTTGTIIENNQIGTTPDGMQPGHLWTTKGIYFDTENYDTTIRNNRIAGVLALAVPPLGQPYYVGSAISLWGAGSGVSIVGNQIGLNANDEPVLGSVTGIETIHFFYPNGIPNVVIGGTAAGEANEIAGHLNTGISVANTYSGLRISGNSIHDNDGLGIDLVNNDFIYGVTPNDPLDPDAGGNGLQNFPEIFRALNNGLAIYLTGRLQSEPQNDYTLEFFATPECDSSGFGEGQMFLGSTSVSTDAAGDALFEVSYSATVPEGWVITSTATLEPSGATSEFSACVPIQNEIVVISDLVKLVSGGIVSGLLKNTFTSDDSYLKVKPFKSGIAQLEFVVTLPDDVPTSLSITLEAQTSAKGLTQIIEMYNWNSRRYESVNSRAASFKIDSITRVNLSSGISDYVQAGTGMVKSRMSWQRSKGGWAWAASIDQVIWSVE